MAISSLPWWWGCDRGNRLLASRDNKHDAQRRSGQDYAFELHHFCLWRPQSAVDLLSEVAPGRIYPSYNAWKVKCFLNWKRAALDGVIVDAAGRG